MTSQEIAQKISSLESDMERLAAENLRLVREREGVYVELDTCVSLIAKLAVVHGFTAGIVKKQNLIVVDLPVGQVSFEFLPSEDHLFEGLPEYLRPVEVLDNREKYRRVMNPGLDLSPVAAPQKY